MAHDIQSVVPVALKLIAEQYKTKELQSGGVVVDRVPSTGALVFHVSAVSKNDPNGQVYSLVVDEKGGVVDAKALGTSEKVELFPPFPRPGTEDLNPAAKTETFRTAGLPGLPGAPVPVTISPSVNDLHLTPGQVFEEDIHVTTPAVPPPPVDVYFLADTTGSMTGILNAVKAGALNIMAQINLSVPTAAYAVGNYKDFAPTDPYCFQHQLTATANDTPNAAAAINTWSASGGGDGPEGQLYALEQIATTTSFWRPGAKKILVWFGDAPGHDPICVGMGTPPLVTALNELTVKNALAAAGITVLAISTNTGYPLGLNDTPVQGTYPCGNLGTAGQGTRIAMATGGAYTAGVNPANISSTIVAMVTAAANLFNNINLVPAGATAPFVTSITPAGGYGPVSGSTAHDYVFHVKFTGPPCTTTDQVFNGTLDVVADGKIVAQKKVTLTVLACERWSYGVKFLCGYVKETPPGVVPLTPVATLRPGSYATEVNILNYHKVPVTVHKYLYTLMHQTEAIGREPRYVGRRGEDAVTLPEKSATFDDCFHLHEMLHEAPGDEPLSIYYLEIVSPVELTVTAVYTANDLRGISVSLEVLQIEGKQLDK
jgi:hypothetical protein